jgi:hypothetical protein
MSSGLPGAGHDVPAMDIRIRAGGESDGVELLVPAAVE